MTTTTPSTLPRAIPPTGRYRRRRFAEEFAAVPNGTRAALRAGYAPSSAHNQANRLLRHPEVVAHVAVTRRRLAEEVGLHGRATLEGERAGTVVGLSAYWTLEPLPTDPPRMSLRLKRRAELTAEELRALDPASFDRDGELLAIVLIDPTAALVELGRLAGVPGFVEEPEWL